MLLRSPPLHLHLRSPPLYFQLPRRALESFTRTPGPFKIHRLRRHLAQAFQFEPLAAGCAMPHRGGAHRARCRAARQQRLRDAGVRITYPHDFKEPMPEASPSTWSRRQEHRKATVDRIKSSYFSVLLQWQMLLPKFLMHPIRLPSYPNVSGRCLCKLGTASCETGATRTSANRSVCEVCASGSSSGRAVRIYSFSQPFRLSDLTTITVLADDGSEPDLIQASRVESKAFLRYEARPIFKSAIEFGWPLDNAIKK